MIEVILSLLKSRLVQMALACLLVFSGGYLWAHHRGAVHEKVALAALQAKFDAVEQVRATTASNALAQVQEKTSQLQKDAAAQEAANREKLAQVQSDNDKLRTDVATGARRLSILVAQANAAPSGPGVSSTPSTPGVGHEAPQRVVIYGPVAERLVRITGDADACTVKLKALQDYINTTK